MSASEDRAVREIEAEVSDTLNRMGLFFRVFSRIKSETGIAKKIEFKKYGTELNPKKMQDLVGVRVALYFVDDVELVRTSLKQRLGQRLLGEEVDVMGSNEFEPRRLNMVVKMPANTVASFGAIRQRPQCIDDTYELQLRTVFSEGWHEVDHDLRYKVSADWDGETDLSRVLNGVLASLENADWAIVQVFEQLSYQHYRSKNWEAMIRSKFRLRGLGGRLPDNLRQFLDSNGEFAKKLLRMERRLVTEFFGSEMLMLPVSLQNLVFVANRVSIHDTELGLMMPDVMRERFARVAEARRTGLR